MKKNIKYNILLTIGILLFSITTISILVSAETLVNQGKNNSQIDYKGYIGSPYHLTTHNIVVNVRDVRMLDIWKASKASVSINSSTEHVPVNVTPIIKSNDLMEKVGVYKVQIGIKEDISVHNTVTIFVIDKQSSMDSSTLILGHDFILKDVEKSDLSVSKEKGLAGIHAYDIESGLDITNEVKEKNGDLDKYIHDTHPTTQTFSVRGVSLTIKAYTKCTSNKNDNLIDNFKHLKVKLPGLGDKNTDLLKVGLILLFLIILIRKLSSKLSKNKSGRF